MLGRKLRPPACPALRPSADAAVIELLDAEAGRAVMQAARMRAAAVDLPGPENLWMAGILDDAGRDTQQTRLFREKPIGTNPGKWSN
jgi:hypothetical protein